MTSHDKNAKEKLTETEELTPKTAEQNFSGICQTLNVRIALAKQSNIVACV